MVPYFQRMKLVSSSWLRPRTILDQTTTVTLGAPRVNNIIKYQQLLDSACIKRSALKSCAHFNFLKTLPTKDGA